MRWISRAAAAAASVTVVALGALGACGGSDGQTKPVDAPQQVIDGVIIYPDTPMIDATSATTGAIKVTIQCGGNGCGKTGNLRVIVDDCMGGVPIASHLVPTKTLTAGVDITNTVDQLVPGNDCVTSYLDVATPTNPPATGDVTASAGQAHVTVTAGVESPATIILDTITP